MSVYVLAPRPTFPDNDRALHQRARAAILDEDFDDVLVAWMEGFVTKEILKLWGAPDTSNNPLVSYVSQLTTPGRYYRRPILHHGDDSALPLIEPGGALSRAGWAVKMQTVERRTTGIGDMLVGLDVSDGELVLRLVDPGDVVLIADPDRPDRVVEVRHLRPRWDVARGAWSWAWDVYCVGYADRPPSYRVLSSTETDDDDEPLDLSDRYLRTGDQWGALVGEAYPYRYADGRPFLPWVQYRAEDNGRLWHWSQLRGLHRGTLHVCTYATYTGRAALDATGSHVLTWNLTLPGADVRSGGGSPVDYSSTGAPVEQVAITPGAISVCQISEPGIQPGVSQIGPGINLAPLHAFCRGYIHDLMLNRGLGQASVEKVSANPASGAALHISDRQRREYAERVEPLYRSGDLELIRKSAALLNLATGSSYPETGYAIVYHRPPRSPGEERDLREADAWAVEHGYRSPVDVFLTRTPGLTREQAIAELRRVQRDAERVAEVEESVEAEDTAGPLVEVDAEEVSTLALNGAQVLAAVAVIERVATGQLPRESGVAMLSTFFTLPRSVADQLLGSIGSGFVPKPEETA